ncbi:MAG: DNA-3-methyladenine glycosylase I [Burkholderiales bacterium]
MRSIERVKPYHAAMRDGPARSRCPWCEGSAAERDYHDREWGVPTTDEDALFELLTLEGAQAGLAWRTILAKRDGYRKAFAGFDPARVARFDARRIDRLVADPSIVRHRGKIESVVANARTLVALHRAGGSLRALVWSVVDGLPRQPRYAPGQRIPARTPQSDALARLLAKHGFRFVGSTTCHALMQAAGLTNDHLLDCFRHGEVAALGARAVAIPTGPAVTPEAACGRSRASSASGSRAARARRG